MLQISPKSIESCIEYCILDKHWRILSEQGGESCLEPASTNTGGADYEQVFH